jgi:hypothetical protein
MLDPIKKITKVKKKKRLRVRLKWCLPCKCEALSLNPSTDRKKRKKERKNVIKEQKKLNHIKDRHVNQPHSLLFYQPGDYQASVFSYFK